MSSNKRRAPRVPIKLEVEFNHESTGVILMMTKDISDNGIFIEMLVEDHPPVETIAQVRLKNDFDDGDEPPLLNMKVTRQTDSGIGLEFIL